MNNGLSSPEHPNYGSWGGRYEFDDKNQIWTDTKDEVIGIDKKKHISPQATIWRWRKAFQEDFALRLLWSVGKKRWTLSCFECKR